MRCLASRVAGARYQAILVFFLIMFCLFFVQFHLVTPNTANVGAEAAASSPASMPPTAAGRSRSSSTAARRTSRRPASWKAGEAPGKGEPPIALARLQHPRPVGPWDSDVKPPKLDERDRRPGGPRHRDGPIALAIADAHDRAGADGRGCRTARMVRPPHRRRHPRPDAVPFGQVSRPEESNRFCPPRIFLAQRMLSLAVGLLDRRVRRQARVRRRCGGRTILAGPRDSTCAPARRCASAMARAIGPSR